MRVRILILALITILVIGSNLSVKSQNGYNVLIEDGTLTAYFAPDAIGSYSLDYYVSGFYNWDLIVVVSWQSDTYPGWHDFYNRTFHLVTFARDVVTLNSWTDDNVRYRVVFQTNSATAHATWTFN